MDSNWESKYPMVYVRALPRIETLSDHATILLTTGIHRPPSDTHSSLNLNGCIGKVFRTWLGWYGRIPLLVGLLSKGGKINCVLHVDTLMDELGI
jgi:hypothetical protein